MKQEEDAKRRERRAVKQSNKRGSTDEGMIDKLAWASHFSCKDVRRLHKSFVDLASKSKEPTLIQRSQFQDVLEAHNISYGSHTSRLFEFFDKSNDGRINFREYVLGLSVLCAGDPLEKFKLSFEIFDADKSGDISKANMIEVLTALSRGKQFARSTGIVEGDSQELDSGAIESLVDRIFADADKNKNGSLTYGEYLKAVMKHPWLVENHVKPSVMT